MQGAHDEGTDRWFGMFRSVGVEPMGEARVTAVRAARRRVWIEWVWLTVLGVGLFLFFTWWQSSIGSVMASLVVTPVWKLITQHRLFSRMRADDRVELFEGRAPEVPAHRDSFTDRLVSQGLVTASRSHRIAVHLRTGMLLEVDETPVPGLVGNVVVTARGPERVDDVALGKRRPLTAQEAEELEASYMPRPLEEWARAVAWGLLAAVLSLTLFCALNGLDPRIPVGAFLVSVAVTSFVLKRRADATRERVVSDLAGGVRRDSDTTWSLPWVDIVWERDGLPGFKRLEGGGLAGAQRSAPRPQTF